MLQTLAQVIFYSISALFAVYSFIMIYVLIRFGQSKAAAITLSALYICALLLAFSAAEYYFSQIEFPLLSI